MYVNTALHDFSFLVWGLMTRAGAARLGKAARLDSGSHIWAAMLDESGTNGIGQLHRQMMA